MILRYRFQRHATHFRVPGSMIVAKFHRFSLTDSPSIKPYLILNIAISASNAMGRLKRAVCSTTQLSRYVRSHRPQREKLISVFPHLPPFVCVLEINNCTSLYLTNTCLCTETSVSQPFRFLMRFFCWKGNWALVFVRNIIPLTAVGKPLLAYSPIPPIETQRISL